MDPKDSGIMRYRRPECPYITEYAFIWVVGYCVYKGVYYTQGQTWDDGCSKKCRCEDVNTGYYSCAQRFVNFKSLGRSVASSNCTCKELICLKQVKVFACAVGDLKSIRSN